MRSTPSRFVIPAAIPFAAALACVLAPAMARAADAPAQQQQQVVVPEVDRRDIQVPRIPSNDFEAGGFAGSFSTPNFGSSAVAGLRLGYHVTEDFFFEGVYAQTRVSDENFRQILPGGIFPQEKETLKYYNLSVGFNVLPGEVFLGGKRAKASAVYVIGGIGNTTLLQQKHQTFNLGAGLRLFLTDNVALQVDARDHVFSLDLLGKRQSTQNHELSAGVTFFF